jgi:hypothetical protein
MSVKEAKANPMENDITGQELNLQDVETEAAAAAAVEIEKPQVDPALQMRL